MTHLEEVWEGHLTLATIFRDTPAHQPLPHPPLAILDSLPHVSCLKYPSWTAWPWWWWHHVPSKCQESNTNDTASHPHYSHTVHAKQQYKATVLLQVMQWAMSEWFVLEVFIVARMPFALYLIWKILYALKTCAKRKVCQIPAKLQLIVWIRC